MGMRATLVKRRISTRCLVSASSAWNSSVSESANTLSADSTHFSNGSS